MIRHVAGIAEIVSDMESAVRFYRDVLGLPVEWTEGSGYAQVEVAGTLHFGIWDRKAAAEASYGDADAADRVPLGFTLEMEVDEVAASSKAVTDGGLDLIHGPRTEEWGQTTARFMSPSGALFGVAETPWARKIEK